MCVRTACGLISFHFFFFLSSEEKKEGEESSSSFSFSLFLSLIAFQILTGPFLIQYKTPTTGTTITMTKNYNPSLIRIVLCLLNFFFKSRIKMATVKPDSKLCHYSSGFRRQRDKLDKLRMTAVYL